MGIDNSRGALVGICHALLGDDGGGVEQRLEFSMSSSNVHKLTRQTAQVNKQCLPLVEQMCVKTNVVLLGNSMEVCLRSISQPVPRI